MPWDAHPLDSRRRVRKIYWDVGTAVSSCLAPAMLECVVLTEPLCAGRSPFPGCFRVLPHKIVRAWYYVWWCDFDMSELEIHRKKIRIPIG